MRNVRRPARACLMALALVIASDACAYLDPGTGSILIQGLIAVVVGGLFYIRSAWARIKGYFSRKSGAEEKEQKP